MLKCGQPFLFLGQCFAKIPNTRVISEPYPFQATGDLYIRGAVSFAEYRQILESTFRLQCKIEKGSKIDHIVMKWNPFGTSAIPYLKVCDVVIDVEMDWGKMLSNT